MIKAIIFDCFGVIRVDPGETAYNHFGGDFDADLEFINKTRFDSDKGIASSADVFSKHFGITKEDWMTYCESVSVVDEEVLAYIKSLKGKYKTALLTNIGKGRLESYFDMGLLHEHFDELIISGEIGFAKPEPEAYEIAASRLGFRLDECVFTDDRQPYIDGAIAVGMPAFLFTSLDKLKQDLETVLHD